MMLLENLLDGDDDHDGDLLDGDDDHDGDLLDGAAFPPCDGDAIGLGDDGALLALLRDTLLKTS